MTQRAVARAVEEEVHEEKERSSSDDDDGISPMRESLRIVHEVEPEVRQPVEIKADVNANVAMDPHAATIAVMKKRFGKEFIEDKHYSNLNIKFTCREDGAQALRDVTRRAKGSQWPTLCYKFLLNRVVQGMEDAAAFMEPFLEKDIDWDEMNQKFTRFCHDTVNE